MVCIAQNIHHPQRFLRCKTRNTTHREAVLRDWQRDPVDAGPVWQPELHLLFTVVFKAEKSILRWLLKTEQSVEQVSLCIRYIISPKNPHTFHSEMMEDSTNLCYSFFFFCISSHIAQTRFITWDNGATKSAYFHMEKKRVPGNLLYLLVDPASEPFAGGIQQRCQAQTGWWDSCSEQQQARAQLPKIIGTHFSTASFPSVTYIWAVPCMQSSLESYTRSKTAAF